MRSQRNTLNYLFKSVKQTSVIYVDQVIHSLIKKWILEAYEEFFKDFMKSCGHEPEAGFIPLEVNQIIVY